MFTKPDLGEAAVFGVFFYILFYSKPLFRYYSFSFSFYLCIPSYSLDSSSNASLSVTLSFFFSAFRFP